MATSVIYPSANEVFKAVAPLLGVGFKVIRLYGITADGACGCAGRENCTSPGKHPIGDGWQHRATGDESEVAEWFEDENEVVPNVGVLLGRQSGVIDVECDTDDAAASLRQWGLDGVDTPTFRSGRGEHRMFRWDSRLPDVAVMKVDGIEVRLGGGEKAAQTVLPPSRHAGGSCREWLPGKSPSDCEIAPLPENFRRALLQPAEGKAGRSPAREARTATAEGKVFKEGEGRHAYLYGEAVSLAQQCRHLDSSGEVSRIHQLLLSLNDTQCRPPYPHSEVIRWTDDAIAWVKTQRRPVQDDPWERMGLRRMHDRPREYEPGTWQLFVVHSDPVEYVIEGIVSPTRGAVAVTLTSDEFMSPIKTARRILAATTDVDPTNPTPECWAGLWAGKRFQDEYGSRVVRKGLKNKLLEMCEHRHSTPEAQRHARLAACLLDYFRRFKKTPGDDVTEPSPTGSPRWIKQEGKDVLTFRWHEAWEKAAEQAGINVSPAELRDMSTRIREITGEKEFRASTRRRGKDGSPGYRYLQWTDLHISALEWLAGVEAQR